MIRNLLLIMMPFLLFNCSKKETTLNSKSPNIIIIFTDDQGYNDVGVFGSEIETPNLDLLAAGGVQFTNFYVAQAVCSASRAALLTGTYPNRLGIHGALDHTSSHGLHLEEETIAEILKPMGYATAIFGKWHLGHHPDFLPLHQGFDEFFGIPYSNDMWPNHPENKDYYPPLTLYSGDKIIDTVWSDQSMFTTLFTDKSIDFIKRNKNNPFFLYLAHPMPHVPLFVSDKFKGKSKKGLYGDVIMEIDWSVGQIMETLKKLDLEENTIVIFLSDNGPWISYSEHAGSAYPLREGKGTSWDGGVKIPAIFHWKNHWEAGLVQPHPAMSIDILPTLAKIVGGNLPKLPIDGKDIGGMFLDSHNQSPQDAYFIYYNRNELQAMVMGDWKLIFPHQYRSLKSGQEPKNDGIPLQYRMMEIEHMELYHIPSDPSEKLNLIHEKPEILEKMIDLAIIAREDLGNALVGIEGRNTRKPGKVL
ncbi:sulfatase family protein [Cecembia rubra]|uniref:Arylsulfatase n=1 Tax=Cecembia rubra TaxID=1485585 RepID=A0A2P8EDT7_9BACT|nr:sulfatase [Cecembia rubra]PSL07645.1 arylsulfatase [Cecembia rubra]